MQCDTMAASDAHGARHNNEESGVNTQSEALLLADALDAWDGKMMMPLGWRERTATELRRLHAENERLKTASAQERDELVGKTCTYKCEAWPECGCAPP